MLSVSKINGMISRFTLRLLNKGELVFYEDGKEFLWQQKQDKMIPQTLAVTKLPILAYSET